MILDALTKVSSAQQVTADAASEDVYDAGDVTPKRDLGAGEPMCFVVAITALGTTTGSSKITAITSSSATLASGNLIRGEVDLAAADHAVGKTVIVPIGQGPAALRYWGLHYDITGTVDYTVDAYGPMPLSHAANIAATYAKNYTV